MQNMHCFLGSSEMRNLLYVYDPYCNCDVPTPNVMIFVISQVTRYFLSESSLSMMQSIHCHRTICPHHQLMHALALHNFLSCTHQATLLRHITVRTELKRKLSSKVPFGFIDNDFWPSQSFKIFLSFCWWKHLSSFFGLQTQLYF